MKLIICQQSLMRDPTLIQQALRLLSEDFEFLRSSYPDFNNWFFKTVIPGLNCGERTLIIELRGHKVAGILILKHSSIEQKLCALRVKPEFENFGLGLKLFDTAFETLKTTRPLLSVSEVSYPKFARLFNYYGFSKEAAYQSMYLPNIDEYAFNGLLSAQVPEQRRSKYRLNENSKPLEVVVTV